MALTRKMLEAFGVDEKAIDQIIDAHIEVVNGLKDKAKMYESDAAKYAEVKAELDGLKKEDYKAKFEKEHSEFEAYKQSVEEKESRTAKEKVVREFFENKGITGTNLDIAMRGASAEVAQIEVENGKIKDAKILEDLVKGTYSGLISKIGKKGAETATPPGNSGATPMTKDEIMKIVDTTERQKAWAQYIMTKGIGN